jgi:hypothetical protein
MGETKQCPIILLDNCAGRGRVCAILCLAVPSVRCSFVACTPNVKIYYVSRRDVGQKLRLSVNHIDVGTSDTSHLVIHRRKYLYGSLMSSKSFTSCPCTKGEAPQVQELPKNVKFVSQEDIMKEVLPLSI